MTASSSRTARPRMDRPTPWLRPRRLIAMADRCSPWARHCALATSRTRKRRRTFSAIPILALGGCLLLIIADLVAACRASHAQPSMGLLRRQPAAQVASRLNPMFQRATGRPTRRAGWSDHRGTRCRDRRSPHFGQYRTCTGIICAERGDDGGSVPGQWPEVGELKRPHRIRG
jgi:hypothetical protein